MRISDWSSDVCSSDLAPAARFLALDPDGPRLFPGPQAEFAALEQAVDDHVAPLHPVVDEFGFSAAADDEQRRHVARCDIFAKLDEELARVVERADRAPIARSEYPPSVLPSLILLSFSFF